MVDSNQLLILLVVCASLLQTGSSQDAPSGNEFINPPPSGEWFDYSEDEAYEVGSTINLRWKTSFDTISLALFQQNNSTGIPLLREKPATTAYQYTVDVEKFDLNNGNSNPSLDLIDKPYTDQR